MTLDAHPVRSNGSSETTESRARSLTEIVAEARKYLGDPVVGEIQAAKLICGLQNTWATLYEHEPDQFTTIELEQADVDALVEFVGQQQRKTA